MDAAIAAVVAALIAAAIGALGGTALSSWLQNIRDSIAYRRRLQDERRERLRLIYLDLLYALQAVNQQCKAMIVVAYDRTTRKQIKAMQEDINVLNGRMENINRQRILISFEESIFDTPEITQSWVNHTDSVVKLFTAAIKVRLKFAGIMWYLPPPQVTRSEAEEHLHHMEEDFIAIRKAVREHIDKLMAVDAPVIKPKLLPPAPADKAELPP